MVEYDCILSYTVGASFAPMPGNTRYHWGGGHMGKRVSIDRRRSVTIAAIAALVGAIVILFTLYALIYLFPSASIAHTEREEALRYHAPDPTLDTILNPDAEVRGVFITTLLNINFPSKPGLSADELRHEIDTMIDTVASAGLNAIYFQARPSSDAFYHSDIFPASVYLTGSQDTALPENFDLLDYLCEAAHARNIAVHAWINPLRAAYGTVSSPVTHEDLGQTNPARLHPEWTVSYAGALYYNAGIPQVRQLVIDGVREIVAEHNIDGVLFDDYFYPYPVSGETFDDSETFTAYAKDGISLEDWRRENINTLIRGCYDAVKSVSEDVSFGIAPFGIWQNDNGSNGGSDTAGMNAYSTIYCDALAWARGGYVDYLAPQLYWKFTTSAAEYDVLVRWWNAQLDGTGVSLLISHATYKADDWGGSEIVNQINYARSELTYRGSILYHYVSIRDNFGGVSDGLRTLYRDEIIYTDPASNNTEPMITSPFNGAYLSCDKTYLIGASDPSLPLTLNGMPVSRTKDGCFSAYVSLNDGENTFTLEQGGKTYTHTIFNRVTRPTTETTYSTMDEFAILNAATNPYLVPGEETLALSVTAPSDSIVTASVGGITVNLTQQQKRPNDGRLYCVTYSGTLQLPAAEEGSVTDLGCIEYTAVRGSSRASTIGASVRIYGEGAPLSVTVTRDASDFKIARDSYYYDDHTPAPAGMTDEIILLSHGYYKLRMGGFIPESAAVFSETPVPQANVKSAQIKTEDGYTRIYLSCDTNVPLDGFLYNGTFYLTVYNVDGLPALRLDAENLLFSAVTVSQTKDGYGYRYLLTLRDSVNFYGYTYRYSDGCIIAEFRNPEILPETDRPLAGKVIVLDAGHGGSDTGALGPNPAYNEKELNLGIVLKAAPLLRELGAEVVLTREDDTTVDIYSRIDFLESLRPDLCISIHQNSVDYSVDAPRVNGVCVLYYADAGQMLAKSLSESFSRELGRVTRGATQQRLALVRNYKFPSALVEVGFMTCVEEYAPMTGEEKQKAAAQALVEGILSYYGMQREFVK